MAKEKGKRFRNDGQTISQPHTKQKKMVKKKTPKPKSNKAVFPPPVPLTDPAQASTSAPATNGGGTTLQGKEKDKDKGRLGKISGFIFLCSGKTKPECYQYRVFGLPAGKKEVVEQIKNGTKLFLFDFDLKLLYGVYEASSSGKMNLEPAAFGGKFPAQVKFKICKDCLPLPDSFVRQAIKDNYQGTKFRPELSDRQVRNLMSLFRPLAASLTSVPPPLQYVAPPRARAPSINDVNLDHPARLPPIEDPYFGVLRHGHPPRVLERQSAQQKVITFQSQWHGTNAPVDRLHPTMEHQGLQPGNNFNYFTEAQRLHFSEGPIRAEPVPEHYTRYRTPQEVTPHDQLAGLESEYRRLPLQRGSDNVLRQDCISGYYTSHAIPGAPRGPSSGGRGFVEGSAPVSSYYSFSGAMRMIWEGK